MNSIHPEVADNIKREQRQRRMRRVQVAMAVFAICMGLVTFSSVAGNPRFETYHTLDVIRLMTAGAGFGHLVPGRNALICFASGRSRSSFRDIGLTEKR